MRNNNYKRRLLTTAAMCRLNFAQSSYTYNQKRNNMEMLLLIYRWLVMVQSLSQMSVWALTVNLLLKSSSADLAKDFQVLPWHWGSHLTCAVWDWDIKCPHKTNLVINEFIVVVHCNYLSSSRKGDGKLHYNIHLYLFIFLSYRYPSSTNKAVI